MEEFPVWGSWFVAVVSQADDAINRCLGLQNSITIAMPLLCNFSYNTAITFNCSLLKSHSSALAAFSLPVWNASHQMWHSITCRDVTELHTSLMSWGSHAKPLILIMIQHIIRWTGHEAAFSGYGSVMTHFQDGQNGSYYPPCNEVASQNQEM